MIEVLRAKIETLSPEQRWLIAVNEKDIMLHMLCNIDVTTAGNRIIKLIPRNIPRPTCILFAGEEHFIEIKMICHYIPNLAEKMRLQEIPKLTDLLVCNYTFTRKYVNNVGGSWIASFVNHYTTVMW